MALNKGKINVGGISIPAHVSYGDQSPMVDAVPLTWDEGDVRYYQEVGAPATLSRTAIKYVCIVAGTPGTWVMIKTPTSQLLWQHQYRYNGVKSDISQYTDDSWTLVDQDVWLAMTGPDVRVIGESGATTLNGNRVPEGIQGATGDTEILEVNVCLDLNNFTPTADALQFTIVNQNGVNVAVGTPLPTGTTASFQIYYGPPAVPIAVGDKLSCKLHTALAAGVGQLNCSVLVSGFKRTLIP